MPIPYYDNPPVHQLELFPPRQNPVRDSRMMNRIRRARPTGTDDVFTVRPVATSMNTTMFTNISPAGRMRYPTCQPNGPVPDMRSEGAAMRNAKVEAAQPYPPLIPNMNMGISLGDLMSIPVSRTRPRALSRPHMLGRAEGMHSIPRLNPSRQNVNTIATESLHQLNMTGTPQSSKVENAVLGSTVPLPQCPTPHPNTIPECCGKTPPRMDMSAPSGLSRKCSRCHNGFVKDRQRSIDGVILLSPERPSPVPCSSVQEQSGEKEHCLQAHCERSPAQTMLAVKARSSPCSQPKFENVAENDTRDHSICCPQCCKEQDCHEGCLGHPSSAPSSTRTPKSSYERNESGNESQTSGKESDGQSQTSEKVRVGRLAFMKSAFKKSFKDKPSSERYGHRKMGSNSSDIAELDSPSIDLSTHPLSPGPFWGGDGSGGNSGAVEAAKSAIGLKKKASTSSVEAVPVPSPLKVKKTRRKKPEVSDSARNVTGPTVAPAEGSRLPSPNESRRVASGPTLRTPEPAGRSASDKSRSASGASVATIEIQVPPFGALGFGAVWEMALVPFEASKMWLRNHPRVMTLAWSVMERGWDMGQAMTATGSRLWGVVFVYSKTGRLKLKKGDAAGSFVMDCARSAAYLLIFMAVGVAAMRVVKLVLDVMGVVGMIINGVVWVVKRLLGHGLFW
jgi:hypothetical protein